MRRWREPVVMALAGALVCSAQATAQTAEVTQEVFNRQGLPLLVANPTPDGGQGKIVAWRKCAPGTACEPVPVEGEDDRDIEPGEVAVGTIFEADARANSGELTTARSIPWRGRVTATDPPSLVGRLRVGGLIRPLGASWVGGWDGDYSLLGVEACRTARGRRCETVGSEGRGLLSGCPGGRAVIGSAYEGWWLRAADARFAADSLFTSIAYRRARDVPVAPEGPTVARTPLVGPVRPATGAFGECVKPEVSILPRPKVQFGLLTVARVRCRCRRSRGVGGVSRIPSW